MRMLIVEPTSMAAMGNWLRAPTDPSTPRASCGASARRYARVVDRPPAEPEDPAARAKRRARVRVAVLLFVLLMVVLYAVSSALRRMARTDWTRTLNVAVVVVTEGAVDPDAVTLLRARARVLEDRLAEEERRWMPEGPRPFLVTAVGPVAAPAPPPELASDGIVDLLKYTWARRRWIAKVDASSALEGDAFDSRIYVFAKPPAKERLLHVEGASEQGGRVGIVAFELDAQSVDWALFAAAHELLHTLGATDKYDPACRAIAPQGLGEPNLSPLYPQRLAEVMACGRMVTENEQKPPETLDELRVGAWTAAEIGWVTPKGR
jgi:hypothetical protein